MIKIANLTDGRVTYLADQPYFTGRHTHLREIAFLGKQLRCATSGPDQLATTSLYNLNIVDQCTDWNIRNRKRVA